MHGIIYPDGGRDRQLMTAAQAASATPVVPVAEDDSDISELLRIKLAGAGYQAVAVASGTEALAAVAERLPDLALLDAMMPGAADYIVRPFSPRQLVQRMAAVLDRSRR